MSSPSHRLRALRSRLLLRPALPARPPGRRVLAMLVAGAAIAAAPGTASAAATTPTNLSVSATGLKKVALTWTAQAPTDPSITGYKIYRGTGANGATTLLTTIGDKYAASFLDTTSLADDTTYSYQVVATSASGDSAKSNVATGRTAASEQPLTGCQTLTGHYKLTQNIDTWDTDCLTVPATANNVSIDCGNQFTITELGTNTALRTWGGKGLLITNCTFAQRWGGNWAYIENGSSVFLAGNTFSAPTGANEANLHVHGSASMVFAGNTVSTPSGAGQAATYVGSNNPAMVIANNRFLRAAIVTSGDPGSSYTGNTMTEEGGHNGIAITSQGTSNSTFANNTISGGSQAPGANDDGIVLYGPDDHLVVNDNTISSYFDAGIEPVGTLTNSTFNNNKIRDTNVGIGNWYNADVRNNTFTGNVVVNAARIFDFNATGYNPAWPDTVLKDNNGVALLNLSDNKFIGNFFTPRANPAGESSVHWGTAVDPGSPVTARLVSAARNQFKNNYLGTQAKGPEITETSSIDTAGSTGNVCPTQTTEWVPAITGYGPPTAVSIGCGPAASAGASGSTLTIATKPASTSVTFSRSGSVISIAAPYGIDPGTGCAGAAPAVPGDAPSPFAVNCTATGINAITVTGSTGADTVVMNAGVASAVSGNDGNDTIRAKNGIRDNINCGAGDDTVVADFVVDNVNVNCEHVSY